MSGNGTGRVEILYNGEWGRICEYGQWGIKNARVVCRQLGYPDAVRALLTRQVPQGSGRIWLSGVTCNGNEQNITSCSHFGWGVVFCDYSSDVGIECSETGKATEKIYSYTFGTILMTITSRKL